MRSWQIVDFSRLLLCPIEDRLLLAKLAAMYVNCRLCRCLNWILFLTGGSLCCSSFHYSGNVIVWHFSFFNGDGGGYRPVLPLSFCTVTISVALGKANVILWKLLLLLMMAPKVVFCSLWAPVFSAFVTAWSFLLLPCLFNLAVLSLFRAAVDVSEWVSTTQSILLVNILPFDDNVCFALRGEKEMKRGD